MTRWISSRIRLVALLTLAGLALSLRAAPAAQAAATVGSPNTVSGTSGLGDIACPSSSTCYAIAASGSSVGVLTVTNGSPGSFTPVSGGPGLSGVACPSSTICYAVGQEQPSGGGPSTGVVVPISSGGIGSPQTVTGSSSLSRVAKDLFTFARRPIDGQLRG